MGKGYSCGLCFGEGANNCDGVSVFSSKYSSFLKGYGLWVGVDNNHRCNALFIFLLCVKYNFWCTSLPAQTLLTFHI